MHLLGRSTIHFLFSEPMVSFSPLDRGKYGAFSQSCLDMRYIYNLWRQSRLASLFLSEHCRLLISHPPFVFHACLIPLV